jgi:hypothetical protein
LSLKRGPATLPRFVDDADRAGRIGGCHLARKAPADYGSLWVWARQVAMVKNVAGRMSVPASRFPGQNAGPGSPGPHLLSSPVYFRHMGGGCRNRWSGRLLWEFLPCSSVLEIASRPCMWRAYSTLLLATSGKLPIVRCAPLMPYEAFRSST